MPEGAYIPDEYVPNKNRKGSFGLADPEGKFMKELVRIDPATPPGRKGPNNPHYHDSRFSKVTIIKVWTNGLGFIRNK